ncbi:Thioredoxin-like fold [Pseudocohnilembus persalinus]|uniref:Thioredoxin-like fold n=1 Tax=Pseudocohnilembus persalinus TaxID=266149 RepID=A0A0V0R7Q9_PSEPJ|nr:Thioredoxin-like fold [Pseudocohnilembus persalinus]|eukprot:KRX10514.1 Thioredoxin-like fold [Pseudocohnilembus persalinus]
MSGLKLYSYCNSSASWRVRIVLNLKNLKYQYIPVNLLKDEQKSPAYRKISPNMAVPTLADGDAKLIESTAIIEYLEETCENTYQILPKNSVQRAKIRGFSEIINSAMQPMQNLRLLKQLEGDHGIDKIQFTLGWLNHGCQALETLIAQEQEYQNAQSNYCFGDKITLADVYLYPQIMGSIRRFNLDVSQYPNLTRIMENLKKQEAFVKSEPRFQPDFPKDK